MAFLRIRAVVRWNDGIDKVNVRLRRIFAGRWLATVLPQLLLASVLELQLASLLLVGVMVGVRFSLISAVSMGITSGREWDRALFKSLIRWTLLIWSSLSSDGLNVKPTIPSSLARGITDLEIFL